MAGARFWIAAIYPIGHGDVFGGMWGYDLVYDSSDEAISDADEQAARIGLVPIKWAAIDDKLIIGRTHNAHAGRDYAVIVRSLVRDRAELSSRDQPRPAGETRYRIVEIAPTDSRTSES